MRVVCDSCHKHTEHTIIEESKQLKNKELIASFLVCSECGHKTIICIDDYKTLRYKEAITKLRKGIRTKDKPEERESILRKIQQKRNQLESRYERLLKEYEERNK